MIFQCFIPSPLRFMLLLLCLLPSLAYSETAVDASLTQGLLAHWKFDGDVTDATGRHDGTIHGDGIRFVQGQHGLAASFAGNSYISVANPDDFRQADPDFSFAAWVLFPDNSEGEKPILSMGSTKNKPKRPLPRIALAKCRPDSFLDRAKATGAKDSDRARPRCLGHLYIKVTNHERIPVPGGTITPRVAPFSKMSGDEIAEQGWLHVVGIVHSSPDDPHAREVSMYVNGEHQNTEIFTQYDFTIEEKYRKQDGFRVHLDKADSKFTVYIGGFPYKYPPFNTKDIHYHNGLIDDLRIYGRVLSAAEIKQLSLAKPMVHAGYDTRLNSGDTLNFQGVFSDADKDGPYEYTWTMGDDVLKTGTVPTPNPLRFSHTFAKAGEYSAKLTVKDAYGNIGEDDLIIKIVSAGSPTPCAK